MANNLYDKGREAFLTGQINWLSDTIKVSLLGVPVGANTLAYVARTSGVGSHEYLSSIPVENVLATTQLQNKSSSDGVADADDPLFSGVSGTITGIVIYKDTGVRTTSRLIAHIDDINGVFHQASGEDIKISWDNESNKIFKL